MDANLRYKVPDGLRPLLEALARETLRSQPHDIVRFAQLFFDELQHHRKSNPNTDIICDPVAYEMFRTDLQRRYKNDDHEERCASPLDEAATKIQAAFRGHCVSHWNTCLTFIERADAFMPCNEQKKLI
ncbi:IQ calmodulin-binding domain-containing protein family protein [Trichostrongylus colubriformis]|uniref:IQ calmodulin-binding domain-containing protein family protein n=1 Tax=Trichostrongylus colubriformis TaxID=6319 RepID=A0AAN8FQ53_TRICO